MNLTFFLKSLSYSDLFGFEKKNTRAEIVVKLVKKWKAASLIHSSIFLK